MFASDVLDWQSLPFYYYLAVAGVVVIALSVGLYAVPGGRMKVPGIVLSIVGSLGVGLAGGVILMGWFGYDFKKAEASGGPPEGGAGGPPPQVQMMGGGGMPQM